jgi:hypothetical protein
MQSRRKVEGCLNCGEVREIAAHGLCFKCYRREDRANERKFASVMGGLSDLGVSRTDVLAIRRALEPYLLPISSLLALASESEEIPNAVNGEQKSGDRFTVHTMSRNGEES